MIKLNTKIEAAAAQDDERPSLASVYYNHETNTVTAADGFILAQVDMESGLGIDDATALISQDTIKAANKANGRNRDPELYVSDSPDKTVTYYDKDGSRMADHAVQGAYPDVNAVLGSAPEPGDADTVSFALDVDMLYRLAQALCDRGEKSKRVVITVSNGKANCAAIGVRPLDVSSYSHPARRDRRGVIMPIHMAKDY